jgi:succinate-semialdehyde dehydrogenase/glutarate-semialdehyde dehydrogenase
MNDTKGDKLKPIDAAASSRALQDRALIGGEWRGALDGRTIEVRNPATDELVARVPRMGATEATHAVDAAAKAFPLWRALPGVERSRVLRRFFDLIVRDEMRLARLMTIEEGKPLSEARGEIAYAAGFVEWSAEEAKRVYGETIPAPSPDKRILIMRQPVGVTVAITPWNFPAAMITRKLAPALATGCTMIVKPASATPLTALALAELAVEAGVPAGVVNVITGDAREIADTLVADARVRAISFTGSTEVGKGLMAKAASHVTKIELELGGHAPLLVFDDADLDVAVAGAMASKFRNAGQTCICANRIYVQAGIYERFAEALGSAAAALRVGNGLDEGVQIGPLIDDAGMAKVEAHVADALALGARIRVGGYRLTTPAPLADRFFEPTVIEGITPAMLINNEETFGPIAPLIRFESEAEAIAMANDTPYGLAAYFFTRDASRLMRVAEALEYGIVGANDGAPSIPQAPFGGMKESGLGREGGKYAMDLFLETKYVSWAIEPTR